MRKKQKKVVYLHKCKLYIAIQAYRKHKKSRVQWSQLTPADQLNKCIT